MLFPVGFPKAIHRTADGLVLGCQVRLQAIDQGLVGRGVQYARLKALPGLVKFGFDKLRRLKLGDIRLDGSASRWLLAAPSDQQPQEKNDVPHAHRLIPSVH
jgi:hypothetical protein